MARLVRGWEIVCPDGRVRRLPYHNEGDASCDAATLGERGCGRPREKETWIDAHQPRCPEGEHTIRPITFDDTPRSKLN